MVTAKTTHPRPTFQLTHGIRPPKAMAYACQDNMTPFMRQADIRTPMQQMLPLVEVNGGRAVHVGFGMQPPRPKLRPPTNAGRPLLVHQFE